MRKSNGNNIVKCTIWHADLKADWDERQKAWLNGLWVVVKAEE